MFQVVYYCKYLDSGKYLATDADKYQVLYCCKQSDSGKYLATDADMSTDFYVDM